MTCGKFPDCWRQQLGREWQSTDKDNKMAEPSAPRSADIRPIETGTSDLTLQGLVLRIVIRLGAITLLLVWCFTIIQPFIAPVVWAIIIAVATYRPFLALERLCGGRAGIAAVAFVTLSLAIVMTPTLLLGDTLLDGLRTLAIGLADGTLTVPPPPAAVGTWPLIGEPLQRSWQLASANLEQALMQLRPQFTTIGTWLFGFIGNLTLGLLQFVVAIFIAAAMLANAASGERIAGRVAVSLAGGQGRHYADLAVRTIRSVSRGIIGVALIQSLLAGLGFLAVGLPAAGLLTLICLILAIVQIGPAAVLIGAVIYGFATFSTATAVLFLVWCLFVGVIDNILKPLLLGRGVDLPMLVIFIGAIGGFLASGILGLFIGPVILALGYTAVTAWLELAEPTPDEPRAVAADRL
jgi:predicted PurR-regulated permease PerM